MENMKITDLCDDILKSIEFEVKYAHIEKTQKDHKSNITHFFRWLDSDESREEFDYPRHEDFRWDTGAQRYMQGLAEEIKPSNIQEREETYERYIVDGDWPHYTLDFDKETREILKIMPDWQGSAHGRDDSPSNFIPVNGEPTCLHRWREANKLATSACNTPVSQAARRAARTVAAQARASREESERWGTTNTSRY